MLRSILWLFVITLAVGVRPLFAQSPTGAVPVKTFTGYFNNTAVYFTAFETNSSAFASANGLVYAPRLSLANRAAVPQMLFFPNVGAPQTVVLQTQPGFSDYSPIWEVLTATWRGPGAMPLITSFAAAVQYNRQGLLLVQRTGIAFNGPVVWVGMNLNRQGGNLAPTISPGEFLGINPAQRTIFFRSHPGYFNGQLTAFLSLETAPGLTQFAPGALPVPLLGTNFLSHNAIANFYVVQGQALPVLDSFPQSNVVVTNPGTANPPGTSVGYSIAGKPVGGQTGQTGQTGQQGTPAPVSGAYGGTPPVGGTTGQTGQQGQQGQQNPVGGVSGQTPVGGDQGQKNPVGSAIGVNVPTNFASLYSPIWHVHHVAFRPGIVPQPLTSLQAIQQAFNAGWITVTAGGVYETFNCPVITAAQPYNPPPAGTGGNPYTPPGGTVVTPTNPVPVTPTPYPGGGY